jgi:hypothetical protein
MSDSSVHLYGSKVSFERARPLQFSDFTLEYLGERRVRPGKYPRDFVYQDFVAVAGAERVNVSWSAGSGDIGPAVFIVGGKQFWLELAMSDSAGRLKSNELVISRK